MTMASVGLATMPVLVVVGVRVVLVEEDVDEGVT